MLSTICHLRQWSCSLVTGTTTVAIMVSSRTTVVIMVSSTTAKFLCGTNEVHACVYTELYGAVLFGCDVRLERARGMKEGWGRESLLSLPL